MDIGFNPLRPLSFDLATFINDYDSLIRGEPGEPSFESDPIPHLVLPVTGVNDLGGQTYGVELTANWQVADTWRLSGYYALLEMDLDDEVFATGQDPAHQASLRSSMDLPHDLQLDLWGRYVDQLPSGVDSYFNLDARLAWSPSSRWEIAVVGQNLIESERIEIFGNVQKF